MLVNVTSSITHNENDAEASSKFKHLHLKIAMDDIQPPKDGKGVDKFDGHITHIEKLHGRCSHHVKKNKNCAECMGKVRH